MHDARIALLSAVVVALATALPAATPETNPTTHGAREASVSVLRWIDGTSAEFPRATLPERGVVRIQLVELGGARGAMGPRQAAAVLRDVRDGGRVAAARLLAIDGEGGTWAWVRARVELTAGGASVGLLLAFERDGDRWVLRELRESSR